MSLEVEVDGYIVGLKVIVPPMLSFAPNTGSFTMAPSLPFGNVSSRCGLEMVTANWSDLQARRRARWSQYRVDSDEREGIMVSIGYSIELSRHKHVLKGSIMRIDWGVDERTVSGVIGRRIDRRRDFCRRTSPCATGIGARRPRVATSLCRGRCDGSRGHLLPKRVDSRGNLRDCVARCGSQLEESVCRRRGREQARRYRLGSKANVDQKQRPRAADWSSILNHITLSSRPRQSRVDSGRPNLWAGAGSRSPETPLNCRK